MGLDAGSTHDSFAISLGRLDPVTDKPQVIGLLEIIPDPREKLEVNFSHTFNEVILPIVDSFNVVRLYTDTWESNKIIHDVEEATRHKQTKIPFCMGEKHTLRHNKDSDFSFVLSQMRDPNKAPIFPKLEMKLPEIFDQEAENTLDRFMFKPLSHFMFQMKTVREDPKEVRKGDGEGYTDDLFRSVWLLLRFLYDPEINDELRSRKHEFANRKIDQVSMVTAHQSEHMFDTQLHGVSLQTDNLIQDLSTVSFGFSNANDYFGETSEGIFTTI